MNKSGQAIIEFIFFLPFIIGLYYILVTIGSSISSGINQQKVTRGYFFNLIHNDSFVLSEAILNVYGGSSVTQGGMFAIGWADMLSEGDIPVAPCFKLVSLTGGDDLSEEACISKNAGKFSTKFIRLKTAFGVCTETYVPIGPGVWKPAKISGGLSASPASCLNVRN